MLLFNKTVRSHSKKKKFHIIYSCNNYNIFKTQILGKFFWGKIENSEFEWPIRALPFLLSTVWYRLNILINGKVQATLHVSYKIYTNITEQLDSFTSLGLECICVSALLLRS